MRWVISLLLIAITGACLPVYADDAKEAVEKVIYTCGQADDSWLDMGSSYSTTGTIDVTGTAAFPVNIYGKGSPTYAHTINLNFSMDTAVDLVLLLGMFSESGGDTSVSTEELKILLNGELLTAIDLLPEGQITREQKKQKVIMVPAEAGANILTLDMSHNLNMYNCWFDYVLLYQPRNN